MKEALMQALVHTVMGIGTVVGVLVIIALVIYCFRFIPVLQKKFSGKREAGQDRADQTSQAAAYAALFSEPESVDETDVLQLVAVIAAAIAAGTGMDPGSFTVRSIKRRGT